MNNHQDITPFERMDDALLEQLLGTPARSPATSPPQSPSRDVPPRADHAPLNCRGERADERQSVASFAPAQQNIRQGREGGFGVADGSLAALYIPIQSFDRLYDEEAAFSAGTLFQALNLPFVGRKGGKCYDHEG